MLREIENEYRRYMDSLDFDSNDWKSKIIHHLRPGMEEEDRSRILVARLEHFGFLGKSLVLQAEKSLKLANERTACAKAVVDLSKKIEFGI